MPLLVSTADTVDSGIRSVSAISAAVTVVLGVFPQPVLDLANHAVPFLR